jgi:hypothetical protein
MYVTRNAFVPEGVKLMGSRCRLAMRSPRCNRRHGPSFDTNTSIGRWKISTASAKTASCLLNTMNRKCFCAVWHPAGAMDSMTGLEITASSSRAVDHDSMPIRQMKPSLPPTQLTGSSKDTELMIRDGCIRMTTSCASLMLEVISDRVEYLPSSIMRRACFSRQWQ